MTFARVTHGAIAVLAAATLPAALRAQRFVVTDSSVRQGRFEAVARSADTILSSYPRAAREVRFRFSLNGAENEFPPGTEHTIYLRPRNGRLRTSVYRFGDEREPAPPTPESSARSEEGRARVTFRLDLRAVLRAMRDAGSYTPPLGAPIARGGLAHVFVLGEPEPLTWNYAALVPGSPLELHDPDRDGVYEGTVSIRAAYTRPRAPDGRGMWARRLPLDGYPALQSAQRIQDAVYRLSLEELRQLVRDDGALSAGAKWPGVWTRDVALASVLSLAIAAPDAVRRSLLAKVDTAGGGRIIQDTGTGGSWPISSDRVVWTLAAKELYEATGDRAWLRQAYDIARRSALADLHAARDPETGLFNGESSFLDWREQSYPRWMQPADIHRSQSLGTNAIHFAAYRALAGMARALGEPSAPWDSVADGVREGMTRYLWQEDRGWFGQYRYGRGRLALSPRADGLGEALAMISGAASPSQRTVLLRRAPVVQAGTPTFWPFITGERFYHNATVWPFVTAYWTWAAADGGNTEAVRRGLDDATRTTALFLTNKENAVASTGHFDGTALNSDRQLWSVAGTLAGTYRILFGLRLEPERLVFRPMIPPTYAGDRTLRSLRYRGATLEVRVHGYGDGIASVRVDGRPVAAAELPGTLSGAHSVEITMNRHWARTTVHQVGSRFAPATPRVVLRDGVLAWQPVAGAARYVLYRNGRALRVTPSGSARVRAAAGLDEYQLLAIDAAGDASFLSEPVRLVGPGDELLVKPASRGLERTHAGYTGEGYLRLSRESNTEVDVSVRVPRDGDYLLDARYANGNGPVNTEDKAGVRSLLVDGAPHGVLVFPQRGADRWAEWGWTNAHRVHLARGEHTISLRYSPLDANMNGRENSALLDQLRITALPLERAARP